MDTAEELLTALIAKRFSYALRKALPPDCVRRINELNQSHSDDACASHGFTDANRMMEAAFRAVMGRLPASHLHEDALCWHDAWQLAQLSGFDHTEEIERLARLRPERETYTVAQLKNRYPQLEEWQAGFDHFALRLPFSDGSYLLLTEPDEACTPSADAIEVAVGLYANHGDALCDVATLPVWHVQALIDYRAARVSDPQTVYDYFVKEMRAGPGKYLSLDLPLTSRPGAFCAEAIDLASCLISHVNRSSNTVDNYRDADKIIDITRRIMNNYIIG